MSSSSLHAHHLSRESASSSGASQGTNIMENWLVKGLRLLYSPKSEDTAQLRKFYNEACENEAAVSRTTLAEALRTTESGREDTASDVSSQFPIL